MRQLHLVTDRKLLGTRTLTDVVEQAVQGGVTHVQLREKNLPLSEIIELGRELKNLLDRFAIPLIINDYVEIAYALDAAGVHVGQADMPYEKARAQLGKNKIVGLSVTSLAEALAAPSDANYLGVGPVFPTATKLDAAPTLGLSLLKEIRQQTTHTLIAIGGIDVGNCSAVFATGVEGVAVISAICAAEDPRQAAELMMLRSHLSPCGRGQHAKHAG